LAAQLYWLVVLLLLPEDRRGAGLWLLLPVNRLVVVVVLLPLPVDQPGVLQLHQLVEVQLHCLAEVQLPRHQEEVVLVLLHSQVG